ncbi:MAG: DUF1800 family protein [Alphaproteobacteria bacterium]|nr:DUF1800 family protein [Alphaproteobacteria bacterium]
MADVEHQGLDAWLEAQLHPPADDGLPAAALAEINTLPALHKSGLALFVEEQARFEAAQTQQRQMQAQKLAAAMPESMSMSAATMPPNAAPAKAMTDPLSLSPQQVRQAYFRDVQRQATTRTLLRALYSPWQLRETMSWFWFNHFNVFVDKGAIRLFLADYEDRAIRPNALGNFRKLLEATLRSPAMLQYLDNAQNAMGHINENYAREIMELHTMGVGSGYTQKDVQELARILTGVSIVPPRLAGANPARLAPGAIRDGAFAFYPARHDFGDKLFLGHVIKGSGYGEVQQALDILCAQPATAQHISKQIAQYFVSDAPPPALVYRMAQRWQETGGNIAAVLDIMFHSPEFRASLGQPLLKDPMHYVLSAVRMAYDDRVVVNTAPINNWLYGLSEPLYGHLTPDGYPLERSAWNGPGQIEARFEIARAIGSGAAGLFKADAPQAQAQPAFPLLQGALYYQGLANTLAPPTRTALAQATSPQEWNIFFLASPDFMRR